jgi:nucleoid DNA-binding protein
MTDRVNKNELTRRLAQRMKSDEATAAAWIDGVVEMCQACISMNHALLAT